MFLGAMVVVQAQAKAQAKAQVMAQAMVQAMVQAMATGQAPSLQKQASLHSPPPLAQWYQEALASLQALVRRSLQAQSSRALQHLPAVSLYRLA